VRSADLAGGRAGVAGEAVGLGRRPSRESCPIAASGATSPVDLISSILKDDPRAMSEHDAAHVSLGYVRHYWDLLRRGDELHGRRSHDLGLG